MEFESKINSLLKELDDAYQLRIKALELEIAELRGELKAYKNLQTNGITLPQTTPVQPSCEPFFDHLVRPSIVTYVDSTKGDSAGTTENTPITTSATKVTGDELVTFTDGATTGRNEQNLA